MKKYKKAILAVLCAGIVLGAAGCAGSGNDDSANDANTEQNDANHTADDEDGVIDDLGDAVEDGAEDVRDGVDDITEDVTDGSDKDDTVNDATKGDSESR